MGTIPNLGKMLLNLEIILKTGKELIFFNLDKVIKKALITKIKSTIVNPENNVTYLITQMMIYSYKLNAYITKQLLSLQVQIIKQH